MAFLGRFGKPSYMGTYDGELIHAQRHFVTGRNLQPGLPAGSGRG